MTSPKNKISACLVIRNEEGSIERALKSIKNFVDEIIVVHDGPCSDTSLAICKKYTQNVFVRPFIGEAEPHRVFTFEKAKNNWMLQLDADEFLSKTLQKNVRKLTEDKTISCYEFIWPYWDGKRYQTTNWPFKKALFQKARITFTAFPHAEVSVDGVTKRTNLRLEHRPNYDNLSFSVFKNKHLEWAKIHARYLLKDPSTYVRYPKNKKVSLPRYYFIVKRPLLYALPLAFYQGFQVLKSQGLKVSFLGLKNSLLLFFYYFFLAIEVKRLKKI